MRPLAFAFGLVVLAVGCEGLSGRATGPQYRGSPVAVVNGRMTADRNISLIGDVRLAVAWFTAGELAATEPDTIETESIIYEPVFPAGFSFGLYTLPRAGGSLAGPSGVSAAAIGLVLAYDDRNRNGALDTYRAGEAPIDRVLGTSLGTVGPTPDPNGLLIVLITEPAAPAPLQRGLNLVRTSGERVSFEQPIPLHLDGQLELNLFTCRELFKADRRAACLDSLRPPDAGVADAGVDAGPAISLSGSVGFSNTLRSANLTVTVGGTNRPDASVELNGVPLSYDAPSGLFRLSSGAPASSVILGGDNVARVNASDAQPLTIRFFMPGNFSVTAPAVNATLQSNTAFEVAWTDSQDAGSYRVNVYRSSPFGSIYEQADLTASPFTVPGISFQGAATLSVQASVPAVTGPNGSLIYPYVNQSIPVTLQ